MELIIKPTARCDFNCKFCSAYGMDIRHPTGGHVPTAICDLINKLKPRCIIVTGGEPLTVDPKYYYELHAIGNCPICPTSNLKDFYVNPEKWVDLFKEAWFHLTTSFNYGDTRRWNASTPYTEGMFLDVVNSYKLRVGKNIDSFIAVIDESNEDMAMKHIDLAKRLKCKVRLNGAIAAGKQGKTYPRYKMMRIYLDIIKAGLDEYECNCSERTIGKCPWNINLRCQDSIRCCYVDSSDKLHVGTCDERLSLGIELLEDKIIPNCESCGTIAPDEFIKPECAYCELCRICNGCNTMREESKKDPNFCDEMKKLEDEIIASRWKR